MDHGRVFVIGDIHGCLEMLDRLMDKIDWHPDRDRLIFLGDYIDRGENPRGVVDRGMISGKGSFSVTPPIMSPWSWTTRSALIPVR